MDIFISITLFIWFRERLVQGADACVMRAHSCRESEERGSLFRGTLIRKAEVINVGSSRLI